MPTSAGEQSHWLPITCSIVQGSGLGHTFSMLTLHRIHIGLLHHLYIIQAVTWVEAARFLSEFRFSSTYVSWVVLVSYSQK